VLFRSLASYRAIARRLDAYTQQLEAELRTARIRVSAHLVPEARGAGADGASATPGGGNGTATGGMPNAANMQDPSGLGQGMQTPDAMGEGAPDALPDLAVPPAAEEGKGAAAPPANGAQRKAKTK